MEADLQRWYQIDYRDRWRFTDGARRLTLRRIWVLITHLPPDSALGAVLRDGKPHWSTEAYLLDDLRMATVGTKKNPAKPHPQRPKPGAKRTKNLAKRIAAARRREAERQRQLAEGV